MSSKKLTRNGGNKNNLEKRKAFKPKSNDRKLLHSNDAFFVKPKKNNSSDVTVYQNNKQVSSQKCSTGKKEQALSTQNTSESITVTKPFDKKIWRFKRYSKKYKLEQWKDMRKTNILRGYDKDLTENKSFKYNFEEGNMEHAENTTQNQLLSKGSRILGDDDGSNNNTNKKSPKSKHDAIFPRRKVSNKVYEETNDKKIYHLKRKTAKEEATKEYKRKKLEKFKKLSRKTKKGQPVMKDRIEILLEEIQNSIEH